VVTHLFVADEVDKMIVCGGPVIKSELAAILVDERGEEVISRDDGREVGYFPAALGPRFVERRALDFKLFPGDLDDRFLDNLFFPAAVHFSPYYKNSQPLVQILFRLVLSGLFVYPKSFKEKMSEKNRRKGALFCLCVLLLACGVAGAAKKYISVSLSKKEIRDMDSSGLILVFYLRISNSSSSPYYLMQYDYRVVIQETDYFSLKTPLDEPIRVEKNGDTLISLPVKISYDLLFEAVKGIEGSSKVSCYVTGLMTFSDGKRREEKIPFAFPGEFPVFKDLEIEIHPLEVNDLSVGGVDFTFAFSCRNKNAFEVVLGNLTYRLALAGQIVSEGVIKGENGIEAQGEKAFSLPLILDFFEVGKELLAVFDRPSAAGQFSGEAQAASVWGDFKLVFSTNENINIVRK